MTTVTDSRLRLIRDYYADPRVVQRQQIEHDIVAICDELLARRSSPPAAQSSALARLREWCVRGKAEHLMGGTTAEYALNLTINEIDRLLAEPAPTQPATDAERKPDGYAYRYNSHFGGTVLHFNHGEELSGGKPLEAVPYYLDTPPPPAALAEKAMEVERLTKELADTKRSESEGVAVFDQIVAGLRADVACMKRAKESDDAQLQEQWKKCEPYLDAQSHGQTWGEIIRRYAEDVKRITTELAALKSREPSPSAAAWREKMVVAVCEFATANELDGDVFKTRIEPLLQEAVANWHPAPAAPSDERARRIAKAETLIDSATAAAKSLRLAASYTHGPVRAEMAGAAVALEIALDIPSQWELPAPAAPSSELREAATEGQPDGTRCAWACKIGWASWEALPSGSDLPMRRAVQEAFEKLTGHECEFTLSGWNAALTEGELAVVENRPPAEAPRAATKDELPVPRVDVVACGPLHEWDRHALDQLQEFLDGMQLNAEDSKHRESLREIRVALGCNEEEAP